MGGELRTDSTEVELSFETSYDNKFGIIGDYQLPGDLSIEVIDGWMPDEEREDRYAISLDLTEQDVFDLGDVVSEESLQEYSDERGLPVPEFEEEDSRIVFPDYRGLFIGGEKVEKEKEMGERVHELLVDEGHTEIDGSYRPPDDVGDFVDVMVGQMRSTIRDRAYHVEHEHPYIVQEVANRVDYEDISQVASVDDPLPIEIVAESIEDIEAGQGRIMPSGEEVEPGEDLVNRRVSEVLETVVDNPEDLDYSPMDFFRAAAREQEQVETDWS